MQRVHLCDQSGGCCDHCADGLYGQQAMTIAMVGYFG
jgi:hypothetical protein